MTIIHNNAALVKEIKRLNMKIVFLGRADLDADWHRDTFRTIVNRFYMITEGEADICSAGKHYKMTEGNIYVIPSDTDFSYRCPARLKKIYFAVNLYNSAGEELPVAPPEGLVLENRAPFIAEMVRLYENEDYQSALTLRHRAEELVLEAISRLDTIPIRSYSRIVRLALQAIAEAPHLSLSAAALAQQLNVSAGHLRNLFAKEVGLPIAKYVRRQVMSAAEADLRAHKLSLQDISAKYGFCDQFHFSRLFTAHFGISPSQYRKNDII